MTITAGEAEIPIRPNLETFSADLLKGVTGGLRGAEGAVSTSAAKMGKDLGAAGQSLLGAFGGGNALNGTLAAVNSGVTGIGKAAGAAGIGLAGMAVAGAVAVAGLLVALKATAGAAAAYGLEILKVEQVTGGTAEQSSLLIAQLNHVGIAVDAGAKSFTLMDKNVANNSKTLEKWFTAAQLSTLRSGDISATLPILSAKYQSLGTALERTAFLTDTFGRSGQQLAPLLSETSAQLQAVAQHAQELGLVWSQDSVNGAVAYSRSLNDLGESFDALKLKAGITVIPLMSQLTQWTTTALTSVAEFGTNLKDVLGIGNLAAEAAPGTAQLQRTVEVMNSLHVSAQQVADEFRASNGNWDTTVAKLRAIQDTVNPLAQSFTDFSQADQAAADVMLKAWDTASTAYNASVAKLTPADFSSVLTTAATNAKTMVTDSTKIQSAQDAVAKAQTHLDQINASVAASGAQTAKAQIASRNSVQTATDALTAAQQRLNAAQAGSPAGPSDPLQALIASLKSDATALSQFDTLLPQLKAKLDALDPNNPGNQLLLSKIAQTGPSAAPLLKELLGSSSSTLSGLLSGLSTNAGLAGQAVSLQGLFPTPADEKASLGATVQAAGNDLTTLVEKYQALPDKTGAPAAALVTQIQGAIANIQGLAASGAAVLSPVQAALLQTAATTKDPIHDVAALYAGLQSLNATFAAHVTVDTTAATASLNGLLTLLGGNSPNNQHLLQELLAAGYSPTQIQSAYSGGPSLYNPYASGGTNPAVPSGYPQPANAPSANPYPNAPVPKVTKPPVQPSGLGGVLSQINGFLGHPFATGGVVMPRAGGTLATVAEAGQPEAIVPLDKAKSLGFGGGGVVVNAPVTVHQLDPSGPQIADALSRTLGWALAAGH